MNAKVAIGAVLCAVIVSGLAVGQTLVTNGGGNELQGAATDGDGLRGTDGPNPLQGDAFAEKTLNIRGYAGVANTDAQGSQAHFRNDVKVHYSEDGTDVTADVDLTEGSRISFFWLSVRNIMRTFCAEVTWTYLEDQSHGLETVPELDIFFDGTLTFSVRDGVFLTPRDAAFTLQPGQVVNVTSSLHTLRNTRAVLVWGEDYELGECQPQGNEDPCAGDWFISANMRFVGRQYSSLVLQARTENAIYRWGSDGYYSNFFLDEWNETFTERYYVEWFGSWDNGDTDWHTLGMAARGGTIHLILDGVTLKTYTPTRPVTTLQAIQLRAGWITTSEVDWAVAAGGSCGFFDDLTYADVDAMEADGWVVLEARDMITATGSSLVLDNDGSRGALIERPIASGDP
ncbi:MAG TPA: hypothetical protein VJ397_08590 [Thermoplasmata archaeon]|nr:hypothetical protein [Thermoplasmata archaeon]